MISESSKPLVSYLLVTYNQEKYVKEAVESALAQTYSPLEIIISDDCSSDRTFKIIKELVDNYRGPHKVIINKNKENLGITGNVSKIMSKAKGELWVMGAGDDIAMPEKTQVFFDHWYPQRDKIFALVSSSITIKENGEISNNQVRQIKETSIETNILTSKRFVGASVAYSPILFKKFGNMIYGAYEDLILYRRALMLGEVLFIKEKLIKHRVGSGITTKNTTINTYDDFIIKTRDKFSVHYKVYYQIQKDSQLISNNDRVFTCFTQRINKALYFHKLKLNYFLSQRIINKLKILFRLLPYLNREISFMSYENINYKTWFYLSLDIFPSYTKNSLFKAIKLIINALRKIKHYFIK